MLIITFTKQINWRGKLLVNINDHFSEIFFTNTDDLRTDQVKRRANCARSVISNHPKILGDSLDVVCEETFAQ